MKVKYLGMTLVELLVSLVLFVVIVTGISAFDIFGNFHAITFDRRAALQNELSLVLEHMTKTIIGGSLTPVTNVKRGGAIGDIINHPFVVDNDQTGLRIRIDSNNNGMLDTGDSWVGYQQVNSQMYYYAIDNAPVPNPNPTNLHSTTYAEVIANHLLPINTTVPGDSGFVITTPVSIGTPPLLAYNACSITLRARWNPDVPAALDNPQVEMTATIITPSGSAN
ncbi:MAG: hypothetical protein ABSE81_07490 [Candidatus Omnitrophota bacterium]|jgi:Tfp pilus assembly protein PilW